MRSDAAIVIPARFQSSRFPGKPLVPLLGKPMVLWVCERCADALDADSTCVATDDVRIAHVVEEAGFNAVMTSPSALTGTDRVAEAAELLDKDVVVNVQGDEPTLDPSDIVSVLDTKFSNVNEVVNGFCRVSVDEDPTNVNIPKVAMSESGRMLYMSRAAVPGSKELVADTLDYFKQVCIYGFTREELRAFHRFGRKSALEAREDIEILRFLELEVPVRMVETSGKSYAVDVPEDVPRVESILREQS
ncbi:MAG: 3-deoxy-manno-octulosonate cytidylyltransferase [Myxococcota bacterium]